jgi:hypothetical protein
VKELYDLSYEVQSNLEQNQTNQLSHCGQCGKKASPYHFI